MAPTAYALRSRLDRREGDDFLERLQELTLWETRDFPPNHPFNQVVAMPDDTPLPPIWLLGSSDYSSELAAQVGMGFAFAHHFATYDAIAAMTNYRAHFKPTGWRETPYAILAVAVVAAETDAEAERLATSMDLNRLRRDRGQYRAAAEHRGGAGLSLYGQRAGRHCAQPLASVCRQPRNTDAEAASR